PGGLQDRQRHRAAAVGDDPVADADQSRSDSRHVPVGRAACRAARYRRRPGGGFLMIGSTLPAVRTDGVRFAYGDGPSRNRVLFDLSVQVPPGQLAVLTGPSGSGKTTLLTLMGGLRTLQAGHIEVLGRDLAGLSASELVPVRRDIGFIFQMHNLFDSLTAV